MKLRIAALGLVCALAACGGKKSTTTATTEAPPTPCRTVSLRVVEVLRAEIGEALAEEHWPKVAAILEERCTTDAWADETVACMQAAARGPDFDACAEQLPDEQEAAVKEQFEREIKPLIDEGAMRKKEASDSMEGGSGAPRSEPTAGAPAPPPPSDPCGGGE